MRFKPNHNIQEKIEQTGLDPEFVEIYSWPQVWGSTACGFGGIGGRAMTKAQTTIVRSVYSNEAFVFIADRFAYKSSFDNFAFTNAWQKMHVPGLIEAQQLGICI